MTAAVNSTPVPDAAVEAVAVFLAKPPGYPKLTEKWWSVERFREMPEFLQERWEDYARAALAAAAPAMVAAERERIAEGMTEAAADRVTWDDGTEFIASADAQRIARAGGTPHE